MRVVLEAVVAAAGVSQARTGLLEMVTINAILTFGIRWILANPAPPPAPGPKRRIASALRDAWYWLRGR